MTTFDTMGHLGLPAPIAELAARRWDAIIVGAGHNGLTCAAYLARAGWQVLVLEARERVGGACTLEEPWPGYRVSPCAYLMGLMHPLVVSELNLVGYGLDWTPASAGLFVPFEDGSSIQLWDDTARAEAEIKQFAPQDLDGWRAKNNLLQRTAYALRHPDNGDTWLGAAPTRDQVAARLNGDDEALNLLFNWSMVDFVEHYFTDERLQMAYLGQGVIGTNASPFDKGTAYIHFHHSCGYLVGEGFGNWGYVTGGMGRVSFILCDIARDAGAVVATETPVSAILPGEGVILEGGDRINAPVVVSNADPHVTLALLGDAADSTWQQQVESVPIEGCTVKCSVALSELPNFTARPGLNESHHRGQVNTPLTKNEWQTAYLTARSGLIPERVWTELYFQTAVDPSVAPAGNHLMSVFAQYVPYALAEGTWDTRRTEIGNTIMASIGRYCRNIPDAIIHMEVLGPPDIEQHIGLTGGHIFQGECLPAYMWDRRLTPHTPMPGVYLCGACTHPGGSVIAANGRNAAIAILDAS